MTFIPENYLWVGLVLLTNSTIILYIVPLSKAYARGSY